MMRRHVVETLVFEVMTDPAGDAGVAVYQAIYGMEVETCHRPGVLRMSAETWRMVEVALGYEDIHPTPSTINGIPVVQDDEMTRGVIRAEWVRADEWSEL